MKRAAPRLAGLALALAVSGCVSVLPRSEPVQMYRFGATPAPEVAPRPGAPAVALGAVVLPRAAAGDGLLAITGDQAAYVARARWVSPAAVLMREAAVRAFAQARDVRLVGADAPAAARLDLSVLDFALAYPSPGVAPQVRLVMQASWTPQAGPAAIRTIRIDRPAGENRVSAIVHAYDDAVGEAMGELVGWVRTQAPAPAPRG